MQNKDQYKSAQYKSAQYKSACRGITLVELLVVVSLMTVLTVLIIPRIRIVNKDRNIREVARVVGSAFANARDRAVSEGSAGVMIVRNTNYIDSNNTYYAGTVLYTMRALPPYSGDQLGETAMVVKDSTTNEVIAVINKPLEHNDPDNLVVQVNDYIRLNHSNIRYRISNVVEDSTTIPATLRLTLDFRGSFPNTPMYPEPPLTSGITFLIERQPRKMESTRVDLPAGNFIDLRYSGPWDDQGRVLFGLPTTNDHTIKIFFDRSGGIDRVYFGDPTIPNQDPTVPPSFQPAETLYLFVVDDDIERARQRPQNDDALNREANLWVSINHTVGGVNVGYNAPPPSGVSNLPERLRSARNLAGLRRSAEQ